IAAAAGLEVEADPDAAAALGQPVGPVELADVPVGAVLSALAEPAGVRWAVKDSSIYLAHVGNEEPTPAEEGYEDGLRRLLERAPAHPAALATRVTVANLELKAGRARAAALGYKAVLESPGNSPELACAVYNLGLLELRDGSRAGARARFLEVIDRAPGTRWADLGWYWIGRSHAEGDDPANARRAFVTASRSGVKEVSSAAALAVCALDLLCGDDESAQTLLQDFKFSTREPHALLATLFEALLRYRAGPTDSRRQRLLEAVARADEGRALGPVGVYLVGRIYHEAGLPRRMCDLYDAASETARGPLALRMMLDAGERYDRLDRRREARIRYLAVAAVEAGAVSAAAKLKLAALEARDGQGAEAVRLCRALVGRPGADQTEVFEVMGRGYELQREYGKAAEAFGRRLPPE
ncbi:MAG: hypothetical protein K2V38_09410, partial [Gemmataceae bacterium]|nr:hypothetical protein [Gemmataceae bacterium]